MVGDSLNSLRLSMVLMCFGGGRVFKQTSLNQLACRPFRLKHVDPKDMRVKVDQK
jgi:hypothetical protein